MVPDLDVVARAPRRGALLSRVHPRELRLDPGLDAVNDRRGREERDGLVDEDEVAGLESATVRNAVGNELAVMCQL